MGKWFVVCGSLLCAEVIEYVVGGCIVVCGVVVVYGM